MEIFVEGCHGLPGDERVARLLVAAQALTDGLVELGEVVEGDIRGLVILRIGAGDVVAERAERGGARQGAGGLAEGESGGLHTGHESGGDGLDAGFYAGSRAG